MLPRVQLLGRMLTGSFRIDERAKRNFSKRPNAGCSRLGEIEMNVRQLLDLPMRSVSVCNVCELCYQALPRLERRLSQLLP